VCETLSLGELESDGERVDERLPDDEPESRELIDTDAVRRDDADRLAQADVEGVARAEMLVVICDEIEIETLEL